MTHLTYVEKYHDFNLVKLSFLILLNLTSDKTHLYAMLTTNLLSSYSKV